MKVMQKYFLAIVPEGDIQDRCTEIKNEIRDQFNVKYALKSPAHITLKMPFSYNEAKEEKLIEALSKFLAQFEPFPISIGGVGTFGKRVIFLKIKADDRLSKLQAGLKSFCKRELNLVDELSDRNFHPHMTIAFKDLKEIHFDKIRNLVEDKSLNEELQVTRVHLLKRAEGRWFSFSKLDLSSDFSENLTFSDQKP
jgi:2'-5' RNA ligase